MKYRYLIALATAVTGTAFGALPAPLPVFKTAQQLAAWRAEMAAESAAKPATVTTSDEGHTFFTGKPYVESSGGYAFKFRSYNPELARWTSEDPSGFPDGANGSVYAPNPISQFDFMGLWRVVMVAGQSDYNQTSDITISGTINQTASQNLDGANFSICNRVEIGNGWFGDATSSISGYAHLTTGGNEITLGWYSGAPTVSSGFATSTVAPANITYSDNNQTVSFNFCYGGASAFGGLTVGPVGISATSCASSYSFSTITYTLIE